MALLHALAHSLIQQQVVLILLQALRLKVGLDVSEAVCLAAAVSNGGCSLPAIHSLAIVKPVARGNARGSGKQLG